MSNKVPIPASIGAGVAAVALTTSMLIERPTTTEDIQAAMPEPVVVEEIVTEPLLTEHDIAIAGVLEAIHGNTAETMVMIDEKIKVPEPISCPKQVEKKCGFIDRTSAGDPVGDYIVNKTIDLIKNSPLSIRACLDGKIIGPRAKQSHVVYLFETMIGCVQNQQSQIGKLTAAQRIEKKLNEFKGD